MTKLKNALENSSNGDTIQLTADITGVSSEIEISKKITLDLNGHTISGSLGFSQLIRLTNSADLTVTDSSTGGTGKIKNTDSTSGSGIFNDSGKLTISGGTFNEDVSEISGVIIAEGYKVTNNGGTWTVSEVSEVTEIIKTKEIDGVAVTFTFDGSNNLTKVEGTGVTYSNGKFTIGNKTYSASLSNDTVTETLESAVYTKTINGVQLLSLITPQMFCKVSQVQALLIPTANLLSAIKHIRQALAAIQLLKLWKVQLIPLIMLKLL